MEVENEGESGNPTHPTQLNVGNMSPWMGRWAPSMAHSRVHWLRPIMKLRGIS